jgi:hypothetical protein
MTIVLVSTGIDRRTVVYREIGNIVKYVIEDSVHNPRLADMMSIRPELIIFRNVTFRNYRDAINIFMDFC